MSEDTRCPGCGAGQVMGLTTHEALSCPYNKAFDFARKNKNEIDAKSPGKYKLCLDYAAAHWREYWVPKIGDWIHILESNATHQITKVGSVCLKGRSFEWNKSGCRPAWPDEIAAATRGSIPIKLPVPALKLELGKSYRARDGWKAVCVEKNSLGNFALKHERPVDNDSIHGHSIKSLGGRLWHRPDGVVDSATKTPPPSSYDLIEEWPADASLPLVPVLPAPAAPDLSQEHDRPQIPGLEVIIEREERFIAARTRDLSRMKEMLRVDRRLARQKALDELLGRDGK